MSSDDIHVLPIGDVNQQGRGHTELRSCWCEPKIGWPCDCCMGASPECWNCQGTGWNPPGKYGSLAAVVTHNAQDGRE